jgi:hypothetical protein
MGKICKAVVPDCSLIMSNPQYDFWHVQYLGHSEKKSNISALAGKNEGTLICN